MRIYLQEEIRSPKKIEKIRNLDHFEKIKNFIWLSSSINNGKEIRFPEMLDDDDDDIDDTIF